MPSKHHFPVNSVGAGGARYATIPQTAEYLGVCDRTVRNMIEDGRLTAYRGLGSRVMRVDLNQVDALMAGADHGTA
jgi:excisionase family DNA binding protein